MDKILVVLPVINLWDQYTIHCMDSIALSIGTTPFEILIIDNASTDDTVVKATDFGNRKMPDRVHLIHNDTNKGVAASWNQGIDYAIANGFTHIIIANNDTLFAPETIQRMYDRFIKGGVLLTSAVDVALEINSPQKILNIMESVNQKEESEAPSPNFSCFMIAPTTVDQVGYFDEGFFPAYFEDNDFHYRCKRVGGNNAAIANTKAVFYHYGSRTQNQKPGQAIVPGVQFQKNQQYFIQKWGSRPGDERFTHPFNDESKDLKYAPRQ